MGLAWRRLGISIRGSLSSTVIARSTVCESILNAFLWTCLLSGGRLWSCMVRSSGSRVFLALVLAFYTALFLFTFHEADLDVWGRMAVGRLVVSGLQGLASAEFPYEDVFAHVPTKSPWVDHEWLAGVVFYEVHQRFGGAGLVWLRAMLGVGTVWLVYALGCRGASASVAAMSVATAVLVLQGFNGVVRAQAFSFLLFALFWWLLEKGDKRVWLLVPASALWANLHGGIATGLGLVAVYAVCSRARRQSLVTVGALATVATLANPYGIHYWRYLIGALSMARPQIVEWRPVALTPLLENLHLKLAALRSGARHRVCPRGGETASPSRCRRDFVPEPSRQPGLDGDGVLSHL